MTTPSSPAVPIASSPPVSGKPPPSAARLEQDTEPRRIVVNLSAAAEQGKSDFVTYLRHLETGGSQKVEFLLDDARLRGIEALYGAPAETSIAEYARFVREDILEHADWEKSEQKIEQWLDEGRRVDVTFQFNSAVLFGLPWELLRMRDARKTPLGRRKRCLLQYEAPPDEEQARVRPAPPDVEGGRVLFAYAGAALPEAAHLEALRTTAGRHGYFDSEKDIVHDASLQALGRALAERAPSVLHLLCHGVKLDGQGVHGLSLRDGDGEGERGITPRQLADTLRDHGSSLRLVVLSACMSGAPGASDSQLESAAEALQAAGVEAVIASRSVLSVPASKVLARELYSALLDDCLSLQEAFLAVRGRVCDDCAETLDWASLQLFARSADGPDLRPFVFRPYRGSRPFEPAHSRFFFGRESELREALAKIQSIREKAAAPQVLIVTGPSGCGKLSFLSAGVAPHLAQGPVTVVRPAMGLGALSQALSQKDGPGGVVVVDSLHELFTHFPDAAVQKAYVERLLLSDLRAQGVFVLCALNTAFTGLSALAALPGGGALQRLFADPAHLLSMRRLDKEALRRTIVEPARRAGFSIEKSLVDVLLDDAGDEPGSMPLIQEVLDTLWLQRSGRMLTLDAYERLGGLEGIVTKRAEQVMAGFDGAKRAAARKLLVELVAMDRGAVRATRRKVDLGQLRAAATDEKSFRQVLSELADHHVVVLGNSDKKEGARADSVTQDEGCVEIAHEALIAGWTDLADWSASHRVMRTALEPFEGAARSGGLVPEVQLPFLRGIVAAYESHLTPERRKLIEGLLDRSLRAGKGHRFRVLAVVLGSIAFAGLAITLAVLARLDRDRARAAMAVSEVERRKAGRSAAEAERLRANARRASLLAGARELLARGEPTWAAQVLLKVDAPEQAAGWASAASEVLRTRLPERTFRGAGARISPDGEWLATIANGGSSISIQRTRDGFEQRRFSDIARDISGLSWSPEGARLVLTSGHGSVQMAHVHDGRVDKIAATSEAKPAHSPSWSAGGRHFAAVSGGRGLVFRSDGTAAGEIETGAPVRALSLSPDGRFALVKAEHVEVWTLDAEVRCARAVVKTRPCLVKTLSEVARGAVFSPDGWSIAVNEMETSVVNAVFASEDDEGGLAGEVSIPIAGESTIAVWSTGQWDRASEEVSLLGLELDSPVRLKHATWVDGATWLLSESSSSVLFRSSDEATTWLPGGEPLAAAPDGDTVLVTSSTAVHLLSKQPLSRRVDLYRPAAGISGIEVDPGGRFVVTSSRAAGASWLFSTSKVGPGTVFANPEPAAEAKAPAIALAPGGHWAAVEQPSGRIAVWNLDSPVPATTRSGTSPRFSADGKWLLTLSGGKIIVYDSSNQEVVRTIPDALEPEVAGVTAAAFNEDATRVVFTTEDGSVREVAVGGGPSSLLARVLDCAMDSPPLLSPLGTAVLFPCGMDARVVRVGEPELGFFPSCGENARFALAADGRSAACAGETEVTAFSLETPDAAVVWVGPGAKVRAMAMSDDGRRLAIATADEQLAVFETSEGTEAVLHARVAQPLALSLDRAGDSVLVVSQDGALRVFRMGSDLGPWTLGAAQTNARLAATAVLSGDGSTLFALSPEGAGRLLPISTRALRAQLASASKDCLPEEVRRTYFGETARDAEDAFEACARDRGK